MSKSFKVAVVGATGLVGREICSVLMQRGFPISDLVLLASPRSAGAKIEWGDDVLTVQLTSPASFAGIDFVLMSAGAKVSAELAPVAVRAGAVVIDNSSHWRMHADVPLVVPEVNPGDISGHTQRGIIANPNCSTIQMVVALAPLHRHASIKRVVVATYQAVSGKGKQGNDELGAQVEALFNHREVAPKAFAKRIAFNCVPQIDVFEDDGYTREEHKMVNETRKILHVPNLGVCATCVRVPVFNGHALSIVAEFEKTMEAQLARELLHKSPGIVLQDNPSIEEYPTPVEVDGQDATYVGRVRDDTSAPNSITLWCVADNLRKGAATNAVQIAELLTRL